MYMENSILIESDKMKVFDVIADVEKWPEFLAVHRNQEILSIDKEDNVIKIALERRGKVKWRLLITIDKNNKAIVSRQTQGPVKGLEARWKFEELPQGTKLILIHKFNYKVFLIGKLMEVIAAKIIKRLARNTLRSIKRRVETGWRL